MVRSTDRLQGDDVRRLATIMSDYIDSHDDVRYIIEEAGIDPNRVKYRDTVSNYCREAIAYANKVGRLDDLVLRVEQAFDEFPRAQQDLATWRSSARRIEDARELIDELSARTADLESFRDPMDAAEILDVLRGMASDIIADLNTSGSFGALLASLGQDKYQRASRKLLASSRKLRASIDHLLLGIDMEEASRAARRSVESGEFLQRHAITRVLIDDREEVAAHAHELIRAFRENILT